MTVKVKEYVRLASFPADDKFRVLIQKNLKDGVPSQIIRRSFKDKLQAQSYRLGVRDGINIARNESRV